MPRTATILAIDPGPQQSAWIVLDPLGIPARFGLCDNEELRDLLGTYLSPDGRWGWDEVCIEMVASYGMRVGVDVFETCVWIGRFMEATGRPARVHRIFRKRSWGGGYPGVCMAMCHNNRAKDADIRQAIIDRYGATGGRKAAIGSKASPGPLYGIKRDIWQALAVGLTLRAALQGEPACQEQQ